MAYIIDPVPVQLDVPRHLRFDNAAVQVAERQWRALGEPANALSRVLMAIGSIDADTPLADINVSMTDWSVLCWASLRHELPVSYTAFLDLVSMGDVISARGEILTAVLTGLYPPRHDETSPAPGGSGANGESDPLATSGLGAGTGLMRAIPSA